MWRQLVEGARFVKGRKIIWMLMSLDLSATLFGAYRVVLPALCATVFHVGPQGYGVLSAAPSAGALLATYTVFRVVDRTRRLGRVLLVSTVLYGLSNIVLAQAHIFVIAVAAGLLIGAFDAMATTIRHAAVQLETPDELRGRVSAIYQMSSRGGPALGDTLVGAVAGALGPVTALTLGGALAAALRGLLHRPAESGPRLPGGARRRRMRPYRRELDTSMIGNTIRSNSVMEDTRGQGCNRFRRSGEEVRHREGLAVRAVGPR